MHGKSARKTIKKIKVTEAEQATLYSRVMEKISFVIIIYV